MFARHRLNHSWNIWQRELPGVRPYYAVKCNPDRVLLETLGSLGAGFDCASGRELMEVADSCYKPTGKESFSERVVYANPCKPFRDLQKAKTLGSPPTVIDSCEEVEKLEQVGWQGSALIRLLVEDKGSTMPFSRKFGLSVDKVTDVAKLAYQKGIPLSGVSFHVGSGCHDPKQYKMAIERSLMAIDTMKQFGHTPNMIDLGGGFLTEDNGFEKSARAIRCAMGAARLRSDTIKFIAEPGRFFATNAFDLFVQVIGKKPSLDNEGWRYTIDESLYGQFSCVPFDHKKPTWLRVSPGYKGEEPRKRVKGTLFGRTCDSLDLIAASDNMEELEVGDWLWFPHMGAYTNVTASEFNGFPKPPTHGIESSIFVPNVSDVPVKDSQDWPRLVKTVSCVSMPQ